MLRPRRAGVRLGSGGVSESGGGNGWPASAGSSRHWSPLLVAIGLTWTESLPHADAAGVPTGFTDTVVLSGLELPTNIAFSPDGRVFVAEKSGIVLVFDSLSDPTPSVFADLRTEVYNFGDGGMTGLTLHPNFPATPYVYVSYVYDAPIGGTAPTYGQPGQTFDTCGAATDRGCLASGRVTRLTATGDVGRRREGARLGLVPVGLLGTRDAGRALRAGRNALRRRAATARVANPHRLRPVRQRVR